MLPVDKAEKAQSYQFAALEHAVRVAVQEQVDCILIAGDLFDSPTPASALFSRTMSLLAQAPCPAFISPGSHDFLTAQSPYQTSVLPQNVYVFTGSSLESVHLDDNTTVWGAGFHAPNVKIPLSTADFSHSINLCVLHSDLQSEESAIFTQQMHLRKAAFHISQPDTTIQQAVCVRQAVPYSAVLAVWQRFPVKNGAKGLFTYPNRKYR